MEGCFKRIARASTVHAIQHQAIFVITLLAQHFLLTHDISQDTAQVQCLTHNVAASLRKWETDSLDRAAEK